MNINLRSILVCLYLVLLALPACRPETNLPTAPASLEEEHKAVVMKYFQEILGGKQFDLMPEVFTPDVIMHRPEGTLANLLMIQPVFAATFSPNRLETTVQEMVASDDYVAVRLHHKMTFSTEQAFLQSRLGRYDVRGRTIEWDAMAMFRFEGGKIAEEWVSADELGKLMQIGTLELHAEEP